MNKNSKITVYYFGDANSVYYECIVTTVKTYLKWKEERSKKAKDIAFILEGIHDKIISYEVSSYMQNDIKSTLNKMTLKEC